ncbi:molybdopterin oxidoreductase family protein [Dictyobacter arantiisoli]|uniref:Molybdopterin oxidoreductase n=1 Tax=Dictyobacter arantiisoli TaxID=2014874 RepID=A0A5A5TH98_9CHLR|nr:molybdopterin oxidoreductase family protein [Dictyobacter arantiisoli]GCF10615.1 molybdopterin oxidoreductase [Dictyobacter arantiisoli]
MQKSVVPVIQRTQTALKATTHCPYCAFQCGMHISGTLEQAEISGNQAFPVNQGRMCAKGWNAAATLQHPERLLSPLRRTASGRFEPISWDDALALITHSFQDIQARYGRDALGIFGGGSLTNEKAYLLGKFARVALGTSQIDYNGRFCMSSAASASITAFGIDRGLPFPVSDIAQAEVVLLVGSNIAETMPPLMQYFEEQRQSGGQLIVVDPRGSLTARSAHLHLRITPGTDAALANGLLHILIRDGLLDQDYIEARTEGFERVKALVATYWPSRVERITGIPEAQLIQVARMLGHARSAMILTARGAEQQSQGVNNVLSYINIALALGLVGRAASGYGCLTGQGNGQGGREHGQKADQLPGYRKLNDPAARRFIADIWGIAEEDLPGPGRSAYEMLDTLGEEGAIRGLLVMGSNMAVSAPRALHVQERLRALDFLVVADFFLSETAQMADIVLPSAQWAEEEGTMTNLEGRVLYRQRAFSPPVGVRTDSEIICSLAQALGKGAFFSFTEPATIFAELRKASAGGVADYAGITYEKIAQQQGVFWPCPTPEHPGTPRLFQERFFTASGRAKFSPVRHQAPAEEPDDQYPLYLTTGRVLAQYQSGTQTRRVDRLNEMAPQPFLEVHPSTARLYGINDGDMVTARTRRGEASFCARVTSTIREDTIFVPFHWGGAQAINRLTNPALDPTSRMPEFKVCAVRIERAVASLAMEV